MILSRSGGIIHTLGRELLCPSLTVPSLLLYVFPVSAGLFPFRLCASADDVATTYYLIERAPVQTVTARVGDLSACILSDGR